MKKFISFLFEAVGGGILHLEHPSDLSFDGKEPTSHALRTLSNVMNRKGDMTRKIDDKMSFQVIRTQDGRVGVKYKGTGSKYNFSRADIEDQHGHKPYLAEPLKALLQHLPKVMPDRAGEWQGGYMSVPETRTIKDGKIHHTPNTITYSSPLDHPEGKALQNSKVSAVIHSELKGPERSAIPLTNMREFSQHPDVHLVNQVVSDQQKMLHPDIQREASSHLNAARRIAKNHSWDHTSGHEADLRTYINSSVRNNETPTVDGYSKHIGQRYDKQILNLKTMAGRERKQKVKDQALAHIKKNESAFTQSFRLHHHIQQATNILARNLDTNVSHGTSTSIGGVDSGGEGYVAGGIKVVDREGFSRANAARSAILKAGKK